MHYDANYPQNENKEETALQTPKITKMEIHPLQRNKHIGAILEFARFRITAKWKTRPRQVASGCAQRKCNRRCTNKTIYYRNPNTHMTPSKNMTELNNILP